MEFCLTEEWKIKLASAPGEVAPTGRKAHDFIIEIVNGAIKAVKRGQVGVHLLSEGAGCLAPCHSHDYPRGDKSDKHPYRHHQ